RTNAHEATSRRTHPVILHVDKSHTSSPTAAVALMLGRLARQMPGRRFSTSRSTEAMKSDAPCWFPAPLAKMASAAQRMPARQSGSMAAWQPGHSVDSNVDLQESKPSSEAQPSDRSANCNLPMSSKSIPTLSAPKAIVVSLKR
ncbi:hypothetical protein E4U53_006672, partial [Claviceps sorghi]